MATVPLVPDPDSEREDAAVEATVSRTIGQVVSSGTAPTGHPESLSTVIADAVAGLLDVDPTDEGFQLYHHVDPEALDALFDHAGRHAGTSWRFSFEVGGETIVVESDGCVRLDR